MTLEEITIPDTICRHLIYTHGLSASSHFHLTDDGDPTFASHALRRLTHLQSTPAGSDLYTLNIRWLMQEYGNAYRNILVSRLDFWEQRIVRTIDSDPDFLVPMVRDGVQYVENLRDSVCILRDYDQRIGDLYEPATSILAKFKLLNAALR